MTDDGALFLRNLMAERFPDLEAPDVDDGERIVGMDWQLGSSRLAADVERGTGEFWWASLRADGDGNKGHGNVFSTAGPFLVEAAIMFGKEKE